MPAPTKPRDCPCDDRLRGLLDGSLCARDVPALMAHLDRCACCRRRLDALAGSPGTWPVTRNSPVETSQTASPKPPAAPLPGATAIR